MSVLPLTIPNSGRSELLKNQQFSIPYIIFRYKEELKKRDAEFVKLSKAKIFLSDNLIIHTIRNLRKYDVIEVITINEQMLLKKKLRKKIDKIMKLQKMGYTEIDPKDLDDDI